MRYVSKLVVIWLLAGIVTVGCATAEAPSSNLAPTGTLRAVFLGSNPVQGRMDAQTGVASGTVPDLVQELADSLDLPYTLTSAPNARGVMDSLINAEADIGFLAYSDSRALEVDYAAPYLVMFSSYLVPTDSAIETGADVDLSGVRVGAVTGQSQELYVSSALTNAEIRYFEIVPSQDELELLLTSGELDAFAINRQRSIDAQAASDSRLRVLPDSFMEVEQSIVVSKGDTAKLEAIKAFVAQMQASEFVAASIERAGLIGVAAPYEGSQ